MVDLRFSDAIALPGGVASCGDGARALSALAVLLLLLLAAPLGWALRSLARSVYQSHWTGLADLPTPPAPHGLLWQWTVGQADWGIVACARGLSCQTVVRNLLRYRRALGPIFMLRSIFGRPVVLVLDPTAMRRVLLGAPYRYEKMPTAVRLLAPIIGRRGLVLADGDAHRRLRRKISPALHHAAVARYSSIFLEEAARLRARIAVSLREDPDAAVDLATGAGSATCAAIVRSFFPVAVLSEARLARIKVLYAAVINDIHLIFRDFVLQSVFFFIPSSLITLQSAEKREIRAKAATMLDEASRSPRRHSQGSLGDSMVDTILSAQGVTLSRADQIDNLLTLLFAGQTTTAFAITFVLWRLARHPDWQARVQEELDTESAWRDASLSLDERVEAAGALPVVNRVIKETLRMHPPVAITNRVLVEPDTLADYDLPKGSSIMIPVQAMHYCEKFWDEPYSFDPDRFLPHVEAKRDSMAWLPFLHGPRKCLGQQFALRELAVMVAEIVYHFKFTTDMKAPEPDPRNAGIVGVPSVELFASVRNAENKATEVIRCNKS